MPSVSSPRLPIQMLGVPSISSCRTWPAVTPSASGSKLTRSVVGHAGRPDGIRAVRTWGRSRSPRWTVPSFASQARSRSSWLMVNHSFIAAMTPMASCRSIFMGLPIDVPPLASKPMKLFAATASTYSRLPHASPVDCGEPKYFAPKQTRSADCATRAK